MIWVKIFGNALHFIAAIIFRRRNIEKIIYGKKLNEKSDRQVERESRFQGFGDGRHRLRLLEQLKERTTYISKDRLVGGWLQAENLVRGIKRLQARLKVSYP
jgi:hypothetical protein